MYTQAQAQPLAHPLAHQAGLWVGQAIEAVRRAGSRTAATVKGIPQVQQLHAVFSKMPDAQKELIIKSLMGAGIGAGTLGLTRALTPQDEESGKGKGVISQALLGALLGGTAGAGYVGAKHLLKRPPPPPREDLGLLGNAKRRIGEGVEDAAVTTIKHPGAATGALLGASAAGTANALHGVGGRGRSALLASLRAVAKDGGTAGAAAERVQEAYNATMAQRAYRVPTGLGVGRTSARTARQFSELAGDVPYRKQPQRSLKGLKDRVVYKARKATGTTGKHRGALSQSFQRNMPFSAANRQLRNAVKGNVKLRGGGNPLRTALMIGAGMLGGDKIQDAIMAQRGSAYDRGYATGGAQ
jgi:hypothetical protein